MARFTSSGIDTILNMSIDDFDDYIKASHEVFKVEYETPRLVIIKGFLEENG